MRLFAGTPWDQPPRCERCQELEEACKCPPAPRSFAAPASQTARLALEKRARGKQVTVVRGLSASDNDLPSLLTRLKSACGAGGSVQSDTVEIQGDHRARVRQLLEQIGYRIRDAQTRA